MTNRYLVTGVMGCIGAWTIHELTKQGQHAVGFDLSTDPLRLKLLMSDEALAQIKLVKGDIGDFAQVEKVVVDNGITHIIHLAALQVPFCRADPVRGAIVNVTGTVNVLETAARHKDLVKQVVYTSSAAVYGPASMYGEGALTESAILAPATHYGVYKFANEGNARIYWQDNGVPTVGLRPHTVYGLGRDRGMTSLPTKAMLSAAIGKPYTITYGGAGTFVLAGDAARALIGCADTPSGGARVFNLGGSNVKVQEVVDAIAETVHDSQVTITGAPLAVPSFLDDAALRAFVPGLKYTPLIDGVRETISAFRDLVARGRIDVANAMA
ncbi:MAG: SDR family oxidoreductase [Chloroflexi bacterium]|nr:SDR family oxidoreductase [Chloroflexota bacterium]